MAYQSEAQLEKQFIEHLQGQDYQIVNIPDYDALLANFRVQCEKYNESKLTQPLSDKEWERILNYLNGRGIFDSAKVLRDKYVLKRDDGSKVYIAFLDEDHTKNTYQVTNQTTIQGKYKNRYDVTLLINGLPLVQVELKRRGVDIKEAVNQIMRYRRRKEQWVIMYHTDMTRGKIKSQVTLLNTMVVSAS